MLNNTSSLARGDRGLKVLAGRWLRLRGVLSQLKIFTFFQNLESMLISPVEGAGIWFCPCLSFPQSILLCGALTK